MESKRSQSIADFPSFSSYQVSSPPLVESPPSLSCEVCVIVPVRNEAETLEQTLKALLQQVDLRGEPLAPERYEVILLANNCSDRSAAIARQFIDRHPKFALHVVERSLPLDQAYIGRVRQLLMDEAYRRFSRVRRRGVIASTDGDSTVSPTWIAATLAEIARGADAVGGRILIDRAGRAALDPYARACHLREVGYRLLIAELETRLDPTPHDVEPRHYQHYGASLAVTTEMYAKVGGLPPVRTPEDVAFYRALMRVDARFRHSPLVRVTTSARQTGRTDVGLANQLSTWRAMGREQQPFLVESAAAIVTRLQARHGLRLLWQRVGYSYQTSLKECAILASMLGISARSLISEVAKSQTFGVLLEQVEYQQQQEGRWNQRWALVDIKQAINDLRLRLYLLRQPPTLPYDRDYPHHDLVQPTNNSVLLNPILENDRGRELNEISYFDWAEFQPI